MNDISWNLAHSYARKRRFWLYLSFALLASALLLGLGPDNRFVVSASYAALVTAAGSILTWVTYVFRRPRPRLIMAPVLVAEVAVFWFGAAQGYVQHALNNFVWG